MTDAKHPSTHPWLSADLIRKSVGTLTFQRGLRYATPHRVTLLDRGNPLVARVQGSAEDPYDLVVSFDANARSFSGRCTCPMMFNCKHVTAALLLLIHVDETSAQRPVAEWERHLQPLMSRATAARELHEVAVMFNLKTIADSLRLTMRPVVRNAKGTWAKSPVNWHTFVSPRNFSFDVDPPVHRALHEIFLLYRAVSSSYYTPAIGEMRIDDFASSGLWSCLSDLRRLGVAFIDATKEHRPVELLSSPSTVSLDVTDIQDSLVVTPMIALGRAMVATEESTASDRDATSPVTTAPTDSTAPALPSAYIFLGQPAHGIAVWKQSAEPVDPPRKLRIGPLEPALGNEVRRLFEATDELVIPANDRARFVREVYPLLRRAIPVSSLDGTFQPPSTTVTLRLTCTSPSPDVVNLQWNWRYQTGPEIETLTLWSQDPREVREHDAERRVLDGLYEVADSLRGVNLEGPLRRFAESQVLTGMSAVRFVEDDMALLQALNGLEVLVEGSLPRFAESTHTPRVRVSGTPSTDWFDLDVSVQVGEETVPLRALFVALARDESHLLLPSRTYFSLDRPEFTTLRELIDEAAELTPSETGALRVNRYQASWWEELEAIAELSAAATQWSDSIAALRDVEDTVAHVPSNVQANLRPYQRVGFEWMSFLYDHALGGVLADDMGLGKTLQTIAVLARARELDPAGAPFLVVAPTSVTHNWVAEFRRFAPSLAVVMVEATSGRGEGPTVAFQHDGAVVMVTSYALFRLDFASYQELPWSGLILDEAQFIKNHQSKGYACARQLSTPFKLALTGTPLENNVMELWSLLSVVAPGLLPDARHFTSYYRTPIERGGDQARLAQLQRRIRPLMLRRTKQEVAVDLPAKIEQVIELDLNPRHRRLYDTQLQRERKKVLGLLDDVQKNRFKIFASLTLLRQLSIDPSLVDEKHSHVPSTKLDALMEQIDEIIAGGHRVLVFSQFTRFLDRVRSRLDAHHVPYCYLDGSTRRRERVVEEFRHGEAPVFLISLKAGGVGLNLTEADYCIILDPWWNPATEAQAVDRTHRIGQTKSVVVIRFVATDTIEEKVMAMKARKSALVASVLEGTSTNTASITADDIRSLLS